MTNKREPHTHTFDYRLPRFEVGFFLGMRSTARQVPPIAWCTDIGEEGLGAEVSEPLPPKTKVTLAFVLPGSSELLQIDAAITRSEGRHHGFRFLFMSESERLKIRKRLTSFTSQTRPNAGAKDELSVCDPRRPVELILPDHLD